MNGSTKFKETSASQMKTSGILYIFASILILVGNFMPNLTAALIFVIIALLMILVAIVFLIFSLTTMLETRPDLSSPINFARFGLAFYLILLLVSNIMGFFVIPGVATIVVAVLQAVLQLIGFIGLNNAYSKVSQDFAPNNKISSAGILVYGSYGILELLFALIMWLVPNYGVWYALLWVDLILGFIVMLVLGIVLTLNSEKLLKQIKGIIPTRPTQAYYPAQPGQPTQPYYPTQDQPSEKYVADTVAVEEIKFCANCGNKLEVSEKFCPSCGAKVE